MIVFFRLVSFFILVLFCSSGFCKQRDKPPYQTDQKQDIRYYEKLVKGYRYYKPDSALFFAQKGIVLAQKERDSTGLALMLNQLGMIEDNFGKFISSRREYLRAKGIYKALNNKKGEAAVTIRLGVVELRKGNYDRAIGYFLEALQLSEAIHDKAGVMEANLTLAEGYLGQKEYQTALKYLKSAEQLDKKLPFSSLSLNICNNFGIIYRELGQFKLAKAYIEKGIHLSDKPELWGLHITLLNNLASVYAEQGFKDKSIRLLFAALQKSRDIQNYIRELQTLTALADVFGKDQPGKSLFYLKQALKLAREKGAHKQEIDLLQAMGNLHKHMGNYRQALQLKELSYALADSFYYNDMSQQISNLQAEYELSKSKERVQELRYQNKQQGFERKIILSVTACIILVLIIVAWFYLRTKKLNNLLNKANTSLKESNTVKDKFFSILAHDLRLPIASVINLLYIIDDEDISPEERHEIINKLIVNCNASLSTLNQLLKWGEMQIKGIRLNPVPFRPGEIIERNINLLSAAAEEKAISVINMTGGSVQLFSDPDHFDFVIRNLLSNAVKFTHDGGSVIIQSEALGKKMVKFTVKDSGVGIEAERIPGIFEISNMSTQGTNNEKGTSLGLIMCKDFIEANKGSIEVKSEIGKGSEFIFILRAFEEGQFRASLN